MLLARGSCRPYSAAASRADKDLEPTAQEASAIEGLPIVGKTSCRRAGPGCETRPPVSRGRHDIAIVAPPFDETGTRSENRPDLKRSPRGCPVGGPIRPSERRSDRAAIWASGLTTTS